MSLDDAPKSPTQEADVWVGVRAAAQPIEQARGLPSPLYGDPTWYEREKRAVFHAGWAGLAFEHDAPEPGDARPIDHLGAPLLLLRDREGRVRVFENVCRHRGMTLIDAPRRIEGAIRCPYHSWCYALDGRLVSTPHAGGPGRNLHPALDRDALGLTELPCVVRFGVVFVNVSRDAPPFDTVFASLLSRWSEFDRPLFFGGEDSAFSLDLATNWKLAVENYCESYHLPWIHPSLNAYSRLEDHYNIVEASFSGQGTVVYAPSLTDDGRRFPDFDGLDRKWDSGAEYITMPPNVLLGVHRDHVFAILLEPQGPKRLRERIAIFYADASAAGSEFADLRAKNAAMWKAIFIEDIGVVEGMQRGRAAPNFDGGRFSPVMDAPTHAFHAWVSSRLLATAP